MTDITSLIDIVLTAEDVKAQKRVQHTGKKTSLPLAVFSAQRPDSNYRASRWTKQEDEYLRRSVGWLTDHEMAEHLGRTVCAVRLRWKRDLHIPAPSKHPQFITAEQAAHAIGVSDHAFCHWCDTGLIPYRNMAVNRRMRLIYRTTFYRWVISPENWVYFDHTKIVDPHLRRLCKLREKRWGDKWLSTPQVAAMHNVTAKDVIRLIYRKELPAVRLKVSKGGRHKNPYWLNWFVLRSDAEKAVFYKVGVTSRRKIWDPTPRAVAWIRKAIKMGLNYTQIARSMGNPVTPWTVRQYIVKKLGIKPKKA